MTTAIHLTGVKTCRGRASAQLARSVRPTDLKVGLYTVPLEGRRDLLAIRCIT